MANQRGRAKRRRQRPERWRQQDDSQHGLDLSDYLAEITETRADAGRNLAQAGERALKVLDGFLADLATALGMQNDRPGMADSIRYLEHRNGAARQIANQAERYRATRNALAHNPDLMLRPEAAERIIDNVESIIRLAAEGVRDVAHGRIVTTGEDEWLDDARDRLLEQSYDQLVVVDERGGVIDLLTERDIVIAEASEEADGEALTVREAIAARGHPAIALLPVNATTAEAVDALRDEQIGAVVLTEHGRPGQKPLGIITRKDLLKMI